MTRQRHVFPTNEIPHKWAHQTQEEARNPQGNLYFRGPTLYSYRDSYPIARLFKKRGAALVLHVSDKYSVTTSGHCYAAQGATRHLPCITVPDVDPTSKWARDAHAQNLKHLTDEAAKHLAKAQRVRRESAVHWRETAAADRLRDAETYSAFFGIRRKVPAFPREAWRAAVERAQRIESPDPVKDARKFKQKAARQAAARVALQGAFDAYCAEVATYNSALLAEKSRFPDAAQTWRDTGKWPQAATDLSRPYAGWKMSRKFKSAGFTMPERASFYYEDGACLLRVDGDQIQTSQGARIPTAHAERIWNLIRAVMARGEAYQHNGHSEHAGDFRIDRVEVDGTLRAGCHVIEFAELQRMAQALGLEDA